MGIRNMPAACFPVKFPSLMKRENDPSRIRGANRERVVRGSETTTLLQAPFHSCEGSWAGQQLFQVRSQGRLQTATGGLNGDLSLRRPPLFMDERRRSPSGRSSSIHIKNVRFKAWMHRFVLILLIVLFK